MGGGTECQPTTTTLNGASRLALPQSLPGPGFSPFSIRQPKRGPVRVQAAWSASSPSQSRNCSAAVRTRREPAKQSLSLVIQQAVPHGPDHDLLLRGNAQLHLDGVDGVPDGDRLDPPFLRNRGV